MKLFKSKKFWVSVGGVLSVVLSQLLGVAEGTTMEVVAIVVAYVLGQGLADFGKESK